MQTHTLKTIGHYFDAVERGEKTFEVRLNDRGFQTGDVLKLVRIEESGAYSPGREGRFSTRHLLRRITYIMQGGHFGIETRYCVLGLGPVDKEGE